MHIVQALWNVYVTTTHTSQLLWVSLFGVYKSQPTRSWVNSLPCPLHLGCCTYRHKLKNIWETFIVHHHRPTDRPIFDTFSDDQPIQKIVHSQMLYKTFLVTALKRCFSWKYFSMNSWVLIHKYKLNLISDYCFKINKCFDRYLHS